MVGKITSGPNIRGALNYNENKLNEGKAELIGASFYHKDACKLTFNEKLNRLTRQAALRERVDHVCIHISLSFDPKETFTNDKLMDIALEYMNEIGLPEQPSLFYRHHDTLHPHIHIVTTSIFNNGKQKNLHNLQRNENYKACRYLEERHGLIAADKVNQKTIVELCPADLKKVTYSEKETKAEIGKVLLPILKQYHFGSLKELNAILHQYNICADPGVPGSRMANHNGLVYSFIQNGIRVGVPIKASKYFFKAQLKHLEEYYKKGDKAKKDLNLKIKEKIILALGKSSNIDEFKQNLLEIEVNVILRTNKSGQHYGITFIDNESRCVFNGSDIGNGRDFTCSKILNRLNRPYILEVKNKEANRIFTEQILQQTDFTKGYQHVLTDWLSKGLLIHVSGQNKKGYEFIYGRITLPLESFVPVPPKISAYLNANGYAANHGISAKDFLNSHLPQFKDANQGGIDKTIYPSVAPFLIAPFVNILFRPSATEPEDSQWNKESKRKKE